MMKQFIVIVSVLDSKAAKYQDFDTLAEADAHVVSYGGFSAPSPDGNIEYWVVDEAAKTVTNDQAQADADVLARSWERLRSERNTLLASSDWTQYTDSPLDDEAKSEWAVHRQLLRDLPASTEDPDEITWPEAPE